MSIAADLIRDLETEAAKTRALLQAVPEDRLDWKPHGKSMSLGALAGHVAENPAWIPAMLEEEMDFAAMGDYRPFMPRSRAELLDTFERNLGAGLEVLRGREDAFLETTWTMRQGEQVLLRAPKREVIRETAVHHWIHHRGQLSVYLRLLDVPLPRVYGPTADNPSFQ